MKQNRPILWITSFAVALLLLTSTAYAQEPPAELENGITWDTTIEQMLEIEGVTDDDELDIYSQNGAIQYGFPRYDAQDEMVAFTYYIFKDDQLMMLSNSVRNEEEANPEEAVYPELRMQLTARYGDPDDQDVRWFIGIFDILDEGALTEDDIYSYDAWDLGGGTKLCLLNIFDQNVTYVFVNETGMTGEAE